MSTSPHLVRLSLCGSILLVLPGLVGAAPTPAQDKTLIEWRFQKPGDFQGWQPSGDLGAVVRDGALRGRAKSRDPLIMGPVFEIAASPLQWVEITMNASAEATSELFWTETLKGKFGGFSQDKHQRVPVVGDSKEHVYRLFPYWQAAKKIIRLRFDPPNAGEFAVRSIRIVERRVEQPAPAAVAMKRWNAAELASQWRVRPESAGAVGAPILMSPLVSIPAAENSFVCVRAVADQVASGQLFCVSRTQFGVDSVRFALQPDGKPHTYNIDVGALRTWRDDVVLLGLELPSANEGVRLESVEVAPEPRGPAEVEVAYFGPSDGISRSGRPAGVTCTLRNLGGDAAENVTATLRASAGATVLGEAKQNVDRLTLYLPKTLVWQVRAERPGKIDLELSVAGPGAPAAPVRSSIELTPAPVVPAADYVPEPKPVKCEYELGSYYFPGWSTSSRWEPIRSYPNRKPILGWYDEANPECADWQIKWAVEHGVSFFMLDWYWCKGSQHLDHWLHQAFMKARYRKYMKWAVMWANHNPANTHSVDDWRKVTQWWIDNYFKMPEYYQIDGRPAVYIWAPSNIRRDVGGSAAAAKLYAMSQEMARAAGYKGIYFVAMSSHESPERVKEVKAEGYEATTTYHGFGLARKEAKSDYFPFAKAVATARDTWKEEDDRADGLLYMPIVDTGWDPRPWHGEKTTVAFGRTPQLFGKLCEAARKYADETKKRIIAIGPWNEWGEGSYIEPYAEYGFADLDALRAAFCEPGDWPPNLIPADVGRGNYDLPPFVAKTAWEFNTDGDLENWSPGGGVADLKTAGGLLSGRSVGHDPVLSMPGLQVEAKRVGRATFRMRSDKPTQVQFFWATRLAKMSGQTCVTMNVPGDGQFHDYEIDLSKQMRWRSAVTAIRLDPAVQPGVKFDIDYIRLLPVK